MKKNKAFIILLTFAFIVPGCKGCSKSGIREIQQNRIKNLTEENNDIKSDAYRNRDIMEKEERRSNGNETVVVQMRENNGVYEVPIEINDVGLYFVFDTGASTISISSTEASFLYKNGKITDEDLQGVQKFVDATGRISEGAIVNLKKVKIGSKILYNVIASVVNNSSAPLLLGQTALSKFGKIAIDYDRNTISFIK